MKDCMPKKDLEHGAYYIGNCRNANIARWNAKTEQFYYWKYKYGTYFIETIKHPEDDDMYDVFVVEKKIEDIRDVSAELDHEDF